MTLPDALGETLEMWAEMEGNKTTTLLAFLVEKALREAIASGIAPAPTPQYKYLKHLLMDNWDKLSSNPKLASRLSSLIAGEPATEADLLRISQVLNVSENYIEGLKQNGDTTTTKTV